MRNKKKNIQTKKQISKEIPQKTRLKKNNKLSKKRIIKKKQHIKTNKFK